jgi:uncharacterized protein
MTRILILLLFAFVALMVGCAVFQRRLLYYPSHHGGSGGLTEWRGNGRLIGYAREVASPKVVWLMMHGNAGEAGDRSYALPSFSSDDSVFFVEYPGYGARPGSPSKKAFNAAAKEGYELLRARFPDRPVCAVGESIGTGPAAALATEPRPPDKIVLILPFDVLAHVAAHHLPYLPASVLLLDNWNNIKSLKGYNGALEIFGARDDDIIPIRYAKALAATKPKAVFHEIEGGHNDWAVSGRVRIRFP